MAEHKQSVTNRLAAFLQDCLSVGSLKGFKYFEVYLRGREELILRVYNDRLEGLADGKGPLPTRQQPNALSLAKSHNKLFLSAKTQKALNLTSLQVGLPPASPCDNELEKDTTKTAFLIAGYARYKCPYVWLRSNHKRLIKLQENQQIEEDNPLRLESVANWKTYDIKAWEIISEVISLALSPPPENPFTIDHTYFDSMPMEESIVCTGAMIEFLQKVFIKDTPYSEMVLRDIGLLQQRHFRDLSEYLLEAKEAQRGANVTN